MRRPTLVELIEWLKPEEPTAQEQELGASISDTDYAIYLEKLNMICEEAKEVFVRSSISRMLLAGDLVVGLYTAGGDMVTALCGTYLHAVSCGPAIKYILREWGENPRVGIHEGDMFFFNDPLYGGLHNPDEGVVMPIFWDGQLIAWASALAQETEIGATQPGMAVGAKSRYDDGLKAPPVKIADRFALREDVIELLGMMTRTPDIHTNDVRARCIACDRIRIRIVEICRGRGADFLRGLMRRIMLQTEEGIREKIRRWKDGVYKHILFTDSVGAEEGLLKTGLTLVKRGERILMDFSESSPDVVGPWNQFGHSVMAHACIYLYGYPFSDLPPTAAIFKFHEFAFREGSLVHANRDASTQLGVPFGTTIIELVHLCYSRMMFGSEEDHPLVTAPMSGNSCGASYGGVNQWGTRIADIMTTTLNTSGGGGRTTRDGDNAFAFTHCPWGKSADIEEMENETPWLHLYFSHLKDSGGFGKHRGGAATTMAILPYHTRHVGLASQGRNSKFPLTSGLFGGYPAGTYPGITVRGSDLLEKMRRGDRDVPFDPREFLSARSAGGQMSLSHNVRPLQVYGPGDVFIIYSGGGGGYGDVLDRDPELVMADLRQELISPWTAQNVYHVVYNPETLEVEGSATVERRQREREARKRRGVPFAEFEQRWQLGKPPDEALRFYGTWPEGLAAEERARVL